MAHGSHSPSILLYTIQDHAPGQRDENGSYAPTPRSAPCRRTRRQGSARKTQTEPCQSAEAGTAAQILPSQADALGYFAPRQNIQLRWILIENIPVSVELWQRAGLSAQQTSLDHPEAWLAASPLAAWRPESSGVVRGQVACTGIHCGRVALTDARGLTSWTWPVSWSAYRIRTAPRALTCGVAGRPSVGPAHPSQGGRRGG